VAGPYGPFAKRAPIGRTARTKAKAAAETAIGPAIAGDAAATAAGIHDVVATDERAAAVTTTVAGTTLTGTTVLTSTVSAIRGTGALRRRIPPYRTPAGRTTHGPSPRVQRAGGGPSS
jgi:hypothetical protein